MRVIILAGGKGVRLAPLTEVIPKPLVPLGGMPILEIIIRQLKSHGFKRITLAVGYLSDLIKTYFKDGSHLGVHLDYSYESQPLGTAGPLSLIAGLNDTFLVMNADVMSNIDYRKLLNFHRAQNGIATISAYEKQVKIDLGVIVQDGENRVAGYIEKPSYNYLVSMGIYIFEPEVLGFIKKEKYLDFPDLIQVLLKNNLTVNYYHFDGYWLDIGRHDDYAKANAEFKSFKKRFRSISNFMAA